MPATISVNILGEKVGIPHTESGVDLWRGPTDVIPVPDQVTGESISLVSTSANDTILGTGARKVAIYWLDASLNSQVTIVDTDGLTPVLITTGVKFVNDVIAISPGIPYMVPDGEITIFKTGSPGVVYALLAGGNKSTGCHYMVPAGHVFEVHGWQFSSSGLNKQLYAKMRSTDYEGVLLPEAFIFKAVAGGSPETVYGWTWPQESQPNVPAGSIIKITLFPQQSGVSATGQIWGHLATV